MGSLSHRDYDLVVRTAQRHAALAERQPLMEARAIALAEDAVRHTDAQVSNVRPFAAGADLTVDVEAPDGATVPEGLAGGTTRICLVVSLVSQSSASRSRCPSQNVTVRAAAARIGSALASTSWTPRMCAAAGVAATG